MKIAVYAICLNEEPFVARFVESCRDADLISVADTGSTDGTVRAFERLGAVVHHIRVQPWRFDDARNAALALVPSDVDICISMDLDTVLQPGWRPALEAAWTPGINQAYFKHITSRRPNGEPNAFLNNTIHARHGVRWKSPCHEYLVFDRTEDHPVQVEGVVMEQFADRTKSRAQYIPLMVLAAQEEPDEARHAHFLGRELARYGRHAEAIVELERYLTLSPNTTEERNANLRLLAGSCLALGDGAAALMRYRQAADEAPHLRGAWVDLACMLYQQKDWAACLEAAGKAMAAPNSIEYGAHSISGAMPEDMASVCAWRIGRPAEAIEYARRAVELAPGVERLRRNLEAMQAEFAQSTAAGS